MGAIGELFMIPLMAIDPGGTSGLAFRASGGTWFTGLETEPEELYKLIALHKPDNIVIENFQAETISKYGLHTVRIVGGVHALCTVLDIGYTLHAPQHRYPFRTEARELLVERGLAFKIHEVDALAHLLRWEHDRQTSG